MFAPHRGSPCGGPSRHCCDSVGSAQPGATEGKSRDAGGTHAGRAETLPSAQASPLLLQDPQASSHLCCGCSPPSKFPPVQERVGAESGGPGCLSASTLCDLGEALELTYSWRHRRLHGLKGAISSLPANSSLPGGCPQGVCSPSESSRKGICHGVRSESHMPLSS